MTDGVLRVAFAHHSWATIRLIDACRDLSDEELRFEVVGTLGPIIDTLRHVVNGDAGYLEILTADVATGAVADDMSLDSFKRAAERNQAHWDAFLSQPVDPDAIVREIDPEDGYQRWAPVSYRLAQALQHGNDHRSQICTTLTSLGVAPPGIDVWNFGLATHEIREQMPKS
jgi:uncharacterized damage-inducible protein DinB